MSPVARRRTNEEDRGALEEIGRLARGTFRQFGLRQYHRQSERKFINTAATQNIWAEIDRGTLRRHEERCFLDNHYGGSFAPLTVTSRRSENPNSKSNYGNKTTGETNILYRALCVIISSSHEPFCTINDVVFFFFHSRKSVSISDGS